MPRSSAADIELALDAAHAAKDVWGKTPVQERSRILNKSADKLEANLELLALVETLDNGKPVRETTHADMPLVVDHWRYFASAVRGPEGGISEIDHDIVACHYHEPLGILVVMGLIADILPPGVIYVVNGFGTETGKPLAQNKRIASSPSPTRRRPAV